LKPEIVEGNREGSKVTVAMIVKLSLSIFGVVASANVLNSVHTGVRVSDIVLYSLQFKLLLQPS
jgi:hypothetical protein